jgi:hypothetical protein
MALHRRKQEIDLLRTKYGELEHGPNLNWILFKKFSLPSGWNRQTTEVLVLIPAGYPTTPPDNFYVRNGLRPASGGPLRNYSENQNVLGGSWAMFSFHTQGWNPSHDLRDGDSLLTFMIGVERRLQELN